MQTRIDLYGAVHKALRARLYDLGIELDRCDFTKPLEVTVALSVHRRTIGFVREHHGHEDEFIEPVLGRCGTELREAVAAQHARAETALSELDALAALVERIPASRRDNGAKLCGCYRAFLADYLQHLEHEETVVNPALWSAYSDAELMALRARLQASIPMPRFIEWLEIMLPAINLDERTAILRGIKAHAPEPAFAAVTALAARVLGQPAWDAVRAQLH